jgi:hypothetical protein
VTAIEGTTLLETDPVGAEAAVTIQEQADEIAIGESLQCERNEGRPVVAVLTVCVYVAQNSLAYKDERAICRIQLFLCLHTSAALVVAGGDEDTNVLAVREAIGAVLDNVSVLKVF